MSANEPVPPPPANILAVDDTPANLQLLVGLLKEHGYRVRPVPSGVLALQAAEASQPDLILLDITMPEMNGYEVCRRLKENPRLRIFRAIHQRDE
jgi:CheY-like chemotaxis protein